MHVVNIWKSSYLNHMYMHMEIKTCSLYRSFEIYFLIIFLKCNSKSGKVYLRVYLESFIVDHSYVLLSIWEAVDWIRCIYSFWEKKRLNRQFMSLMLGFTQKVVGGECSLNMYISNMHESQPESCGRWAGLNVIKKWRLWRALLLL